MKEGGVTVREDEESVGGEGVSLGSSVLRCSPSFYHRQMTLALVAN